MRKKVQQILEANNIDLSPNNKFRKLFPLLYGNLVAILVLAGIALFGFGIGNYVAINYWPGKTLVSGVIAFVIFGIICFALGVAGIFVHRFVLKKKSGWESISVKWVGSPIPMIAVAVISIAIFIVNLCMKLYSYSGLETSVPYVKSLMVCGYLVLTFISIFPLFFGFLFLREFLSNKKPITANRTFAYIVSSVFAVSLGLLVACIVCHSLPLGEWNGTYIKAANGVWKTNTGTRDIIFSLSVFHNEIRFLFVICLIAFILTIVPYIYFAIKKKTYGSALYYKKKLPSIIVSTLGLAFFVTVIVFVVITNSFQPLEYTIFGHTLGAVAGTVTLILIPVGFYGLIGVFPFFLYHLIKGIYNKKHGIVEETISDNESSKQESNIKEFQTESIELKEDKEEIKTEETVEKKTRFIIGYRFHADLLGFSSIVLGASLFGFIASLLSLISGYFSNDSIFQTILIIFIILLCVSFVTTTLLAIFLKIKLNKGLNKTEAPFLQGKVLPIIAYALSGILFIAFFVILIIDIDGTYNFNVGGKPTPPMYLGTFAFISTFLFLGLGVGYNTVAEFTTKSKVTRHRSTIALLFTFLSFFVSAYVTALILQGSIGSDFYKTLNPEISKLIFVLLVMSITALVLTVAALILFIRHKKKDNITGKYLCYRRFLSWLIPLVLGGASLVVGIIMSSTAVSLVGILLLWVGCPILFTSIACIFTFNLISKRIPPEIVNNENNEENEEEKEMKDEFGFVINQSNFETNAKEANHELGVNISTSQIEMDGPAELAKSLSNYFKSQGLALEENDAIRLLSFMSYSHLLFISGFTYAEDKNKFLSVLTSFFDSEYQLLGSDIGLDDYYNECIKLNDAEPVKPAFIAIDDSSTGAFNTELKPLITLLNDFSSPHYLSENNSSVALPPNVYHIVFINELDTGLEGNSEVTRLSSIFSISVPSNEAAGNAETYPITDHDFSVLVDKAKDTYFLTEDSWKKIDTLANYVSSMNNLLFKTMSLMALKERLHLCSHLYLKKRLLSMKFYLQLLCLT